MRISDWSSDVCSSDLLEAQLGAIWHADLDDMLRIADIVSINAPHTEQTQHLIDARRLALLGSHASISCWVCPRSEEHTSELQSLMRLSYADICCKQKKRIQPS